MGDPETRDQETRGIDRSQTAGSMGVAHETSVTATGVGDATLAHQTDPAPTQRPTPTIPGYEIEGELGRGGMGVVYKARQVRLNRVVALKMILAGAHADPDAAVRFLAEAEAVARLQHPNIVQIYEIGEHDGLPFFELEYVDGRQPGRAARRHPLAAAARRRGWSRPWPAAIAEAHRLGIVHRDLKPANVLLAADGTPKIADFGLAKRLDVESGLTRDRLDPGLAQLHGPRAGRGQGQAGRPGGRRLRPGGDPVRAADRPPAVPGGDGAGDARAGQDGRAGAAVAAGAGPAARRRDDRLKCLQKDPAQAVRLGRGAGRGPAAVPGRRADRGAAGGVAGAGLAVVPAEPGRGRVAGRGGGGAGGRGGRSRRPSPMTQAERRANESSRDGSRAESSRRIAALDYERGQAACEKGEIGPGLLWTGRELALRRSRPAMPPGSTPPAPTWPPGNASTPGSRAVFSHADAVTCVAFSPDGKTVLTGSDDKTARLWDAATGQPIGQPLTHQGAVMAVAFSPDGKTVLTGSEDKTARLWDAATGQPLGQPMTHQGAVWAVAFSPDGKTVLTGSADGTARLWDAATGQPIGQPLRHQGAVWAVAFSPDGKTVLTGSEDKTARLWDAATGQPIGQPMPHQGAVCAVAFSPDGKTVLTGSEDRTARLWDAATGQPIGPPAAASRRGLGRGVQPRRQDRPDRERGQDGAALGRRHRAAHRPTAARIKARSGPWRSAPTARPS